MEFFPLTSNHIFTTRMPLHPESQRPSKRCHVPPNLFVALPQELQARILSFVPVRARRNLVLALPEVRGALEVLNLNALGEIDLLAFAPIDQCHMPAPVDPPSHLPRLVAVCAHDLRVLRLHGALSTTEVIHALRNAADLCHALEELTFRDGGAVCEALAGTLFKNMRHLRAITVHDPRDGILRRLGEVPMRCVAITLTGTAMEVLSFVAAGLRALSEQAMRKASIQFTLHVVDNAGRPSFEKSEILFAAAQLFAFFAELRARGHSLCAGLSSLTLRNCISCVGEEYRVVADAWDLFHRNLLDAARNNRFLLPTHTLLSYEHKNGGAFALKSPEISELYLLEEHRKEQTRKCFMEKTPQLSPSHCLIDSWKSVDISTLLNHGSIGSLCQGQTGLRIEMSLLSNLWSSPAKRSRLTSILQREGRRVLHLRLEEPERSAWNVHNIVRWLPDLQALSLSRAAVVHRQDEIAALLDWFDRVRVLHVFNMSSAMRGIGTPDETAAMVIRALPAFLRSVAAHLPRLECFFIEDLPKASIPDGYVSAESLSVADIRTLRAAMDWFESKRVDVEITSLRSVVESWATLA